MISWSSIHAMTLTDSPQRPQKNPELPNRHYPTPRATDAPCLRSAPWPPTRLLTTHNRRWKFPARPGFPRCARQYLHNARQAISIPARQPVRPAMAGRAARPEGAQANMSKMLASEASWQAADMCMEAHGGFAFAREYHIERKFRETRLYRTAPISTNFILSYVAEHVLGLPRSY